MSIGRAWWITGLLFLLTTINCVDRLVLASVAPVLQNQFHLSNTQYSYIVIAFMVGMALGQLPAGAMLDRIGVRRGLPIILIGWSIVNALHVFARQVWQFSMMRLVMGLFESGNYSGGLKAVGQNLPARHRAVALGFFNSGFLLGSVLAPPIVVYTTARLGWQAAFAIPAAVGMLWLIPWFAVYREGQAVAAPALNIEQPSFHSLLRLRETWGVIAVRATSGPISQFYWYWLPLYFVRGRHASMAEMSTLASVAYIVGALGNVVGGYFSGVLIRNGMDIARSRRWIFLIGTLLCTGSTALVPITPSLTYADLLAGAGIFGVNVMSCMLLAVMSDVFPQAGLARVGGLTGAGEGVVSISLTLSTGLILDRFSFVHVFVGASVLPLLSAVLLFVLVRPSKPTWKPMARASATGI
jgi:ACS family hexuronate transporter-like MFS transporter